ncbi:MAG: hypothetical protein ACK4M7_07155, partial [Burkholderiales bacterium]
WKKERVQVTQLASTIPVLEDKDALSHSPKQTSSKSRVAATMLAKNNSYLAPSMAKRRTSDMFIKVRNAPNTYTFNSATTNRLNLVENITQSTLNYAGKDKAAKDTDRKVVVMD